MTINLFLPEICGLKKAFFRTRFQTIYISNFCAVKGWEGADVNRVISSSTGVLLEIRLTVHLKGVTVYVWYLN